MQIKSNSIFSSTATYVFNGEQTDLPSSPALEKKLHENRTIYEKNNAIRRTSQLPSTKDKWNIMKGGFNAIVKSIMHPSSVQRSSNDTCTEYRVIDMAIAYDSTYCNALNGKENAEAEIQSIISRVSNIYQRDVCLKVKISYLEGFCDVSSDPYDEILKKNEDDIDGVLHDFKDYWNENKTDIDRTVAHLFTDVRMQSGTLGSAFLGTACRKRWGYGVEEVPWSKEKAKRAGVVAHELGHNMGADHVEDPGCAKFVMNSGVSDGSDGFHSASETSIGKYIGTTSCMRTESV